MKEARTLSADYKITIINSTYSEKLTLEDKALITGYNIQLIPVSRLQVNNLTALWYRLVKKAGEILVSTFKLQTPLALGYAVNSTLDMALRLKADAYICHQELGLYCGCQLLKRKRSVSFDFEDWYSEDLLPQARRTRPVKLLKGLETNALRNANYISTTSKALALKLAKQYNVQLPEVIYNVFNKKDNLLRKRKDYKAPLKLFWFSQTVGPGRGLEQFINILHFISVHLELHLFGNISTDYRSCLKALMPQQHLLVLHDLVPNDALADKISCFDIGLALELNTPPSRNYTITNKFFQYIQAGLPVIASETEGQIEAFKSHQPGFMLKQDPDANDIEQLRQWLNDKDGLLAARKRAIDAASLYNWENEQHKLLTAVKNLMGNSE